MSDPEVGNPTPILHSPTDVHKLHVSSLIFQLVTKVPASLLGDVQSLTHGKASPS